MQLPECSLPVALAGSSGRILRVTSGDGSIRHQLPIGLTTTNTSLKAKLGDTVTLYEIDQLGAEHPRCSLLISTSDRRYNLCETTVEVPTPPSGPPPAASVVSDAAPILLSNPLSMPESYGDRIKAGWKYEGGNWLPPT